MAFTMVTKDGYLPVPTKSLDENVRSAMVSRSSSGCPWACGWACFVMGATSFNTPDGMGKACWGLPPRLGSSPRQPVPGPPGPRGSPPGHHPNDFQHVAVGQAGVPQPFPGDDVVVEGDGHPPDVDVPDFEKRANGGAGLDVLGLSVHGHPHLPSSFRPAVRPFFAPAAGPTGGAGRGARSMASRRAAAAAAGSGASRMARITATPAAPASTAWAALAGVMPPTAMTGTGAAAAARARAATPRGGRPALEAVAKTWPNMT